MTMQVIGVGLSAAKAPDRDDAAPQSDYPRSGPDFRFTVDLSEPGPLYYTIVYVDGRPAGPDLTVVLMHDRPDSPDHRVATLEASQPSVATLRDMVNDQNYYLADPQNADDSFVVTFSADIS